MAKRNSKWLAIYRNLRATSLRLQPGESIGKTIRELADEFAVNFKTVMKAISLLQSEKLITAHSGTGLRVHYNRPKSVVNEQYIAYIYWQKQWTSFEREVQDALPGLGETNGYNVRMLKAIDAAEIRTMSERGLIAGAIVSFYKTHPLLTAAMEEFSELGIPVVTMDEFVDGYDGIGFDNIAIGRQLARLIASHTQFRRILFTQRKLPEQPEFQRETGIRAYLDEAKVSHQRARWTVGEAPEIEKWINQHIRLGFTFDAIALHLSSYVEPIRRFYSQLGLPIPYIATIGLPSELQEANAPGIAVPSRSVIEQAIKLLMRRISTPDAPVIQSVAECAQYYPD